MAAVFRRRTELRLSTMHLLAKNPRSIMEPLTAQLEGSFHVPRCATLPASIGGGFLEAGGSGLISLAATAGFSNTAPAESALVTPNTTARAKSVVVLYLYGAPSQMDTLDPKPEAPVERRGEFHRSPPAFPASRLANCCRTSRATCIASPSFVR